MFEVFYRSRNMLDKFRAIDTFNSVKLSRCWFDGDILYGYRGQFRTVALSADQIVFINDLNDSNASILVADSFTAGEFVYDLPF